MYIQIEKAAVGYRAKDEFACNVARTPEEISELIEAGFDYGTESDGLEFFKARTSLFVPRGVNLDKNVFVSFEYQ